MASHSGHHAPQRPTNVDARSLLDGLRSRIADAVALHCGDPDQKAAALQTLHRPGYALHGDSHCRAGVFTLDVYRAISGRVDKPGFDAAAAVELQMEAAFMFDAVADGEGHGGVSSAEELALALTILSCGSGAASEAVHDRPNSCIHAGALRRFHQCCVAACAGQFLDATLERHESATLDDALRMTSLKAGSLGRFSATLAAGLATQDPEVIHRFEEVGFNLFVYTQLIDDVKDACPRHGPRADLLRRKKTIPLVFFRNHLASGCSNSDTMDPRELDAAQLHDQFKSSGAELYTLLLAETFLNRAKRGLADLESHGYAVRQIGRFTEPHAAQEAPAAS